MIFDWILTKLAAQAGQIVAEQEGTTETDESAAPAEATPQETDISQEGAPTPGAETQPEPNEFEKLIPPNELPPELKGHWKRMHGAYTKLIQGQKDLQQKAAVVDNFYSNPDYARQVLVDWAARNGYQLAPIGQQVGQAQQQRVAPSGPDAPPAELVEACRQARGPDMEWMAESDAKAIWAAQKFMMQPLVEQAQKQQQAQRYSEYDNLASEFSEQVPGWEQHEGQMEELLGFLQSPQMRHPKYGSKLQLLYQLATGKAAATAEAVNRISSAAKNRTTSSASGSRVVSNLQQRIKQASSSQDAWALAREAALNQVRGLPDE